MAEETSNLAVVVKAVQTSRLKSFFAVLLWLSSIHLVVFLSFLMLFVLSFRWSLTLFVAMLTLMVIPLYETSPFAVQVSKFICKHGPGHFPLTCVMEDKDALDPKRTFLTFGTYRSRRRGVILFSINWIEKTFIIRAKEASRFSWSKDGYLPTYSIATSAIIRLLDYPTHKDTTSHQPQKDSNRGVWQCSHSLTKVFAVEPHSVLPIGILALCEHAGYLPIQRLKALASSAIFLTPFLRHIWSWMGLVPASKKIMYNLLSSGCSCVVIPGGVREMLFMEHDCEVVYLKKRIGFIRVAIETGSPLVPCFVFGQARVYKWWKPSGKLYDELCRNLRFAPVVFWGMFGSPIPFPHPMHFVVGKPIEVKKNPHPTQEEVLELHSIFISSLKELYERHKVDFGYEAIPLYIH